MARIVTERELAELESLLAESHAKHAATNQPVHECGSPKCVEARWGIEWLRRSRACLYGVIGDYNRPLKAIVIGATLLSRNFGFDFGDSLVDTFCSFT